MPTSLEMFYTVSDRPSTFTFFILWNSIVVNDNIYGAEMKKKKTTQLIWENKKTNQALVMIPLAAYDILSELLEDPDAAVALKRKNDPNAEYISLDKLEKSLGL